MADAKKKKPRAVAEGSTTEQGVPFLVLLTLTDQGRNQAENAAANLEPAERHLEELGGQADRIAMTFGQYDAFVAGIGADQDVLTNFAAWISEQGYFSTQTLIGVTTEPFNAGHH